MTGYQEIITDPSYAGQIITFTFPHIGNVGTNPEDIETHQPGGARRGAARRHHRARQLARRQAARRLAEEPQSARHLRRRHARRSRGASATAARPTASWCMRPTASSTSPSCARRAQDWPGLDGMDLAIEVTTKQTYQLGRDHVGAGQGLRQARQAASTTSSRSTTAPSATSCAASPTPAARSRWCRRRPRPRTSCATSPTACSCRTARAIRRRRRLHRAGDPGRARQEGAAVRHLPRPPAPGAHPGRQDAQDGARPSRRQPAGQGPDHRQGRDHLAEPRLLRHAGIAARRTSR